MLVGPLWKVGANVGAVTLKSGYGSTCGPALQREQEATWENLK